MTLTRVPHPAEHDLPDHLVEHHGYSIDETRPRSHANLDAEHRRHHTRRTWEATGDHEHGRTRCCPVCGGDGWTDGSAELRRDGRVGDTTCIGCNGAGVVLIDEQVDSLPV